MLKGYKKFLLILLAVYVVINFIPVDRSNPPIKNEPVLSPELKAVFKKSCYDCHSNQVNYPFYSYLAPASWIVSGDVQNGRKHLNFSEWDAANEGKLKEEILEEVQKGAMPLPMYTFMHPSAKLSAKEIDLIKSWVYNSGNNSTNNNTNNNNIQSESKEHEKEHGEKHQEEHEKH